MFPACPAYGFPPGFGKPGVFEEIYGPRTQGGFVVYPSMLGGWCAPAYVYEVNPWAWQWSGEAIIQKPWVKLTYGMVQTLQSSLQVNRGPVPYSNQFKIVCPRPSYPLPKWINVSDWEDDEDETSSEEDEEMTSSSVDSDIFWGGKEEIYEDFDIVPRFLTSFTISPDAENLPSPFFPPSRGSTPVSNTFTSLSPDANELPQPYFDSDPPVFVVNATTNVRGIDSRSSPWSNALEPMVAPNPEDLPPPCFEVYARPEDKGLNDLVPLDCQNRANKKGVLNTRAHWTRDKVPWPNVT